VSEIRVADEVTGVAIKDCNGLYHPAKDTAETVIPVLKKHKNFDFGKN